MSRATVFRIRPPAGFARTELVILAALVILFAPVTGLGAATPAFARQSTGGQTADGVKIQVIGEPNVAAATAAATAGDLVHPTSEVSATLTFVADQWHGGY